MYASLKMVSKIAIPHANTDSPHKRMRPKKKHTETHSHTDRETHRHIDDSGTHKTRGPGPRVALS